MSKSADLFCLIQSMSRSEKRYFKMHASMHTSGVSKYVQLFDVIEACPALEGLEETIEREGLQNPEIKHYLYQSILKSLHLYTLEESVDGQLSMLCHQAEILLSRQLYDQFQKMLVRIKDIATRYERPLVMMDILEMEYRFLLLECNRANFSSDMTTLFEELFHAHALHTSMMHYWRLDAQMFLLTKSIGIITHSDQERQHYENIMANEYMQDGTRALSGASRVYYHHVRSIYYDAICDHKAQIEEQKCILNIMEESNRMRTSPQPYRYFSPLYNICAASINLGIFDEFFAHYDRLLECAQAPPSHERYGQYIQALALLPNVYIRIGEFEKAEQAMQKVAGAQQHFRGSMMLGMQNMIHIQEVAIRFGQTHYHRCLEPLNAILCRRSGEASKKDAYYDARLLELLVHFELGHYDVLDSLVRSVHKFLRSRESVHKLEASLLSCMRNISTDREPRAVRRYLETLYENLLLLLDDPYEHRLMGLFDILSWVESKLSGRSFADIAREKYQAKKALTNTAGVDAGEMQEEGVEHPKGYVSRTQQHIPA